VGSTDVLRGQDRFEDFLNARSRAELRGLVSRSGVKLTLPQAQRLVSHAESLERPTQCLRLGVVHTYTSDLLNPWLELAAALHGFELRTYHAPYGLSPLEAEEGSGLVAHEPDLTLLLLRREDLHPELAGPVVRFTSAQQEELGEEALERLRGLVGRFRARKTGQIVLTVLPSMLSPGLGVFDAQSERSESAWWANLKAGIGRCLRESIQASLFLDFDEVLQQLGRQHFFDHRLWYLFRFPFAADGAREIARRVIAVGAAIKLPKAKVIVLDADNTLWGGIIGEDGLHGIALGPDYPGNVYVEFQRRLLDYQQRGFILALCSKNNRADVDQVLKEHPHQLLRDELFAARRVNWLSKPDNLLSLAEELNLGLESFVFIDDSDHECAAVRQLLPQVEVVQTPATLVHLPTCLEHVARLEVLSLTAEDLVKTELYAQERRRRELKEKADQSGGDSREYLASLKMRMRVGFNDPAHLTRLTQLTQKTNQFTLTTRRYNEQQMQEFIRSGDWLVAHFTLSDVFGDSGIVGLALIRALSRERVELDSFLMSCRVIGREAESAFLHVLLRHLAQQGVREVVASYIPTPKNALVKKFLPDHDFEERDGGYHERNLCTTPPRPESDFPIAVEVVRSS
jgi:FkbH-like protein